MIVPIIGIVAAVLLMAWPKISDWWKRLENPNLPDDPDFI